ncbi:GxxExxY protein [Polaribacter vadi]|uniref:GxxExxY protein n=1 Tax=Polaribacter TaxID=52959 RepID=UPI001C09105F|nr:MULTISPECIES: GxxExxY protein [Polaribacter]MBU3013012.1 GxxExxY protein [Polaribacter vadi]MDO6742830.1 GxxExxY protein [Polaribacter sp. 1_MG-2023]
MIYKKESYDIVGTLFEVHNNLGGGFLEVVYKDALEYELKKKNISFEREKEYVINYKDVILPHKFYADFVILDKIVLEIKSVKEFHPKHIAQCINYLKVSGNRLCILVNFQNESLEFKRIVL